MSKVSTHFKYPLITTRFKYKYGLPFNKLFEQLILENISFTTFCIFKSVRLHSLLPTHYSLYDKISFLLKTIIASEIKNVIWITNTVIDLPISL